MDYEHSNPIDPIRMHSKQLKFN